MFLQGVEAVLVKTKLLTLESNFSDDRQHFVSSAEQEFVNKAKEYKLISFNGDTERHESEYASSK